MISNANILISGGGTGGHIFPAIAIANEIVRRNPDANILFVGAKDKMEMQKVPAAGYRIEGLWISGIQRSFTLKNLLFPIKLIDSFFAARKIVKTFKPHIAIGTGGFASGPALNAAASFGTPIVIQEQNSYPGITNKILGKKAAKVCVAYSGMEKYFSAAQLIVTGNPVRKNVFENIPLREVAAKHFFKNPGNKILFIVGGSLGARTLNNCLIQSHAQLTELGIQIIWQTGSAMAEECKAAAANNPNVFVTEFISEMQYAYSAADVIISRAGAIAISELCLVGKPVILVPFPFAAEDHQTKNAMALVNANAAICIKDADAQQQLIPEILKLVSDEILCKVLADGIKKLGIADATDRIVDEIEKLIA
ncbi:MAG: undecaprenyldiphospho-muramoylpentapeptide beta-N-acetylglucosaminyltransferase [Bacteroidetes bacterium]|nr:undecaprenyldiphospho-muramoylpentapeptide beta-N-acetylglucosaminyltransferase [Bacteroidota bacterium]MBP7400626.1 undecaprenyldiphospho-muramoylpentapeptide beta-N-acetylglucosaminyltransferase [Chitinophagales bacterium]MBK7109179.1 undecaprenyldiphospho-muramoylpentapeptide beta-N-acetylglucosaminyltransferase [Bacteroidota bacterium]MBK8681737.1 undecaprenyldiphospho-muramoylpentapeptide beta-N-acetylglucosaminyltransferase [Bacteroidota bacterium]MBP8754237.1 undecaprenyldiphospho-mur